MELNPFHEIVHYFAYIGTRIYHFQQLGTNWYISIKCIFASPETYKLVDLCDLDVRVGLFNQQHSVLHCKQDWNAHFRKLVSTYL